MSDTTIPKTKEEIIKGHYTCTCAEIYWSRNMSDLSCVLHEQGGEIGLIMDEYAQQQAVSFIEWAWNNGWQPYDAHDRWINTDQGNVVLPTPSVYESFLYESFL